MKRGKDEWLIGKRTRVCIRFWKERELRKIVLLKIQYGSGKIRDKRRNIGKLTKFELDFYTFNKEEKIICTV